ncbi:MAG: HAMP domain-containing histidine kinase [Alistipes sp.]|nr:HAMP domain-containing histidine kinase [Alistipes sp.]
MRIPSFLTAFTVCILFAFAHTFPVRAGEQAGPVLSQAADSALTAYYKICREHRADAGAPAMCDTLFRRAGAAGNVRIQAVALCIRLDHFYYKNDREKIVEGVERVQEFCRKHPKEDLRYFYYFVWSSRLITYYIKQNQSNTAIYETRKMLSEAEADDYPEGVASCYRMLANLYLTQGAWRMAYDNFRRQIEVLEHNGIDDINLPTQYASLAQCALELDMPDSAFVALRKAASLPKRTTYQEFTVNKGFGLYHIRNKNFDEAKRYVDAAEELFRSDPALRFHTAGLRYLQTAYFKASGQYDRALETILATQRDTVVRSSGFNNYSLIADLGDVYWHLHEMGPAAANYREYIRLSDSVRNREIRTATDDFSGILEISRLHNETKELQYDLQRKRLRNTYLIICLLAGVLVMGGVGYARVVKLNRRLKASEATVLAQNEHLRISGEELLEAKEQAEQASRMKTEFIQHISHEVRTPLNSIVGFSQVLASEFRDKPSTGEYASIIEANSASLLRLFDDVLEVAYLDQTGDLPRNDVAALNGVCNDCVESTLPELHPGVSLLDELTPSDPVVRTNLKRIEQVLLRLLRNAAKFTFSGHITLTYDCLMQERLLRFTVTDTGPGIPADLHEEVFGRFVKLDPFSQGTGLGLSICRLIAARLGGRLFVDREYASGCRMIFEVPFDLSETSA